jgi:hypothetical protein
VKSILFTSTLVHMALVLAGCRLTSAADAVPVISTASVPLYPEIAQSARVQGSVRIRVTIDGKRVTHIENLSLEPQKPSEPTRQVSPEIQHAYRALAQSAEENVRTWTFLRSKATLFIVTYRYRLLDGADTKNSKVSMSFPTDVEISIGVPVIEINTP